MRDYITFAAARAGQAENLALAIERVGAEVREWQARGALAGPGPIFVGIGASLAAAAAPVWSLRSRGIHSWRLGSGDLPLPFPVSEHAVVGVSQSGRSTETLAVLASLDEARRFAVVNNAPSPIADLVGANALSLGSIPDSYASTIGYTATVAALGLIADAWSDGSSSSAAAPRSVATNPEWASLSGHFRRLEDQLALRAAGLAATFAGVATADFVGSGQAVGSAEAGALLFREVARLPSAAMSTRTYLHGSMESAGLGVHVVLGDHRELEVADTLSEAGHKVILVTSEPVPETPTLQVVLLPKLSAAPRAILEALVMQTLVEAVAVQAGIDIEEFVFTNSDTKIESAQTPGVVQ
jgi:fructoselysine-6-P-deglycase FrlB-like protein